MDEERDSEIDDTGLTIEQGRKSIDKSQSFYFSGIFSKKTKAESLLGMME